VYLRSCYFKRNIIKKENYLAWLKNRK